MRTMSWGVISFKEFSAPSWPSVLALVCVCRFVIVRIHFTYTKKVISDTDSFVVLPYSQPFLQILGGLRQRWTAGHGWKCDDVDLIGLGSAGDILLAGSRDRPSFAQRFLAIVLRQRPVTTVRWCSDCSRERGPAEPRSTFSRSRRRREPDRRRAILQAQAQSYVLKRLLWHRPRDVVAGATGHIE